MSNSVKMCQMRNKKKDKLSYTVMLHCSAVTGGFVCHFWSISMTWGNRQLDKLCRFSSHRQHLPQPPCAYAIWPTAQCPWTGNLGAPSSRCLFSSTFLELVDTVPMWKPTFTGGLREAEVFPLHAWCHQTCYGWETTFWKSTNLRGQGLCHARGTDLKIHPWHQPGQKNLVQFRGRRTFQQPFWLLQLHLL